MNEMNAGITGTGHIQSGRPPGRSKVRHARLAGPYLATCLTLLCLDVHSLTQRSARFSFYGKEIGCRSVSRPASRPM